MRWRAVVHFFSHKYFVYFHHEEKSISFYATILPVPFEDLFFLVSCATDNADEYFELERNLTVLHGTVF